MTSKNLPAVPGTSQFVELIKYLPDTLLDGVLEGRYEVLPGKVENKPVVRDAENGQLIKGSGQYPATPDMGEVSKKYAHTRTKNYREAMDLLVPIDEGPDKRGSFAWWYEQAMKAAVNIVEYKCEDCGHVNRVEGKPDANLIFRILEMKHGKAPQTVETTSQNEHLVALLNQPYDIQTLKVHAVDPQERARRENALVEEGEFSIEDEDVAPSQMEGDGVRTE